MALGYSFNPASPQAPYTDVTVSLTGLTATTAYVTTITHPSGAKTPVAFTTDGSGNASFHFVGNGAGTATFDTALAVSPSLGTATFFTEDN